MNATRNTTISLMLGALLFLLVPAAVAQEPKSDPERFRAELLAYVQDLSRLSPAMFDRVYKREFSLAEAEQTIKAFTPEELRMIEQNVSQIPFWREVPQMLAEKSLTDPSVLAASSSSAPAPVAVDPEMLRKPMLAFVGALRSMPKELVGEEYFQRINRVEGIIKQLDGKQLAELQVAFNQQMPAWTDATSNRPGRLRLQVQSTCTGSFPTNVICELNAVFDTIAAIPSQVATFATNAVNFIANELKSLFETIKNAIPTSPSGVLSLIGLSGNPNFSSLLSNIPTIDPPCPTSVPGIGTVGDIRAMYVCQRGPEFLGRALFNIFPKDLWGMKPKIAAGLFYFPWTYLCGSCYSGTYERLEDKAHSDHRTLLTTNLNVVASTIVDQGTVNGVQGQVNTLDSHVTTVNGKLDTLTGKTDDQLRLLDVVVTTRASEVSVDQGRAEARDVLADVAKTESKLDQIDRDVVALIAEQNKTAVFLGKLRDMALRQRIEDDLIRNATPDRIGLFETPEAQGGFLELAIRIVEETLAKRAAAGVNIGNANKEFQKAQTDYNNRSFKNAYTGLRKAYQQAVP